MIHNDQMGDLQLEDVEDYSADYPPVGFPNAEENMAPMASSDDMMTGNKSPKYRRAAITALIRNNKWSLIILGVIVIIFIGILAAAVGKDEAQTSIITTAPEPGVTPTTIDASTLDQDVLSVLKSSIEAVYVHHNMNTTVLQDDAGLNPQRKAMFWMAKDVNVNSEEHTEKLQRYVLAVLFYATNVVPNDYDHSPAAWKTADLWMSTAHSCDWMGVICNQDKVIVSIDLEYNRLSGTLPLELEIIGAHMESLDFTSNSIAMSGSDFNLFRNLPVLKTLLMDDNYLYHDQGLPQQFHHLTNLEKLRLSYNLFEGHLGGGESPVLGSMTKLTHLEIESNYLTGPMPSVVGNLDQLTYLYMRRNDMSFNLDFLKTGQLENLCKSKVCGCIEVFDQQYKKEIPCFSCFNSIHLFLLYFLSFDSRPLARCQHHHRYYSYRNWLVHRTGIPLNYQFLLDWVYSR
jgi:hypothetical protein